MIESGDWYFVSGVLAAMVCMALVMGIYSAILFIALSPLAVNEKNRNDRWVNFLFKLLSRDREQNFTPREFIMARALLVFSLVALAIHLLFPV